MTNLVIQQSDQGKTLAIHVADHLVIRLAENPSTGYQWEISTTDGARLDLLASAYEPTGGALGGGGTRSFTFQVQEPGTASIRLHLKRAWEAEEQAIAHFGVTLHVQ